MERAGVLVVFYGLEEGAGGLVGEVGGGEDVGNGNSGGLANEAGLGEVDFEEGAEVVGEWGEGVECLAGASASGPARASSGGEGDDCDFAIAESGFADLARLLGGGFGGVENIFGFDVLDVGAAGSRF